MPLEHDMTTFSRIGSMNHYLLILHIYLRNQKLPISVPATEASRTIDSCGCYVSHANNLINPWDHIGLPFYDIEFNI